MLQRYINFIENEDTPSDLKPILTKLCTLYGLWSLEKHLATLYQGTALFSFVSLCPNELFQAIPLTIKILNPDLSTH